MPDRTRPSSTASRSRLTGVSGVGAVSLLVMATLLIGVVASPVLASKSELRTRDAQPQRQVEHVRQIAQSLVRAASKLVRTQRDVPVAIGMACLDRPASASRARGQHPMDRGAPESRVRVELLNLPPPTGAAIVG